MKTFAPLLLLFVLLISCKSQKEVLTTNDATAYNPRKVEATIPEISVVDYIRRLSGVTVRGSRENITVIVRVGPNSLMSNQEPLLLIDGNPFYGSFAEFVIVIPPNDIESVSVYKTPTETAIYGIRGANGVIDVKMK